jgi:phospholipase C
MPHATNVVTEANPIPSRIGDPSPIKYCIYIIKENRTYDQVLGDMPEGNGDPSLCLFTERITPNHHKLAREFVLLDNFYVESEVSADGHEWTVGAYATDFVEKTWPLSYGHNKHKKYPYPAEGNFLIAHPAGGYLWDRAKEAGVTYRSYGEFINNGKTTNDPGVARVTALRRHYDPWFRLPRCAARRTVFVRTETLRKRRGDAATANCAAAQRPYVGCSDGESVCPFRGG